MKLNIIFFLGIVVLGGLSCKDSGKNQLKVEDDYFINPIFSSGSNPNALFYGGKYYYTHETNDMILLWETNDITDMDSAVCKEVWRPTDPKSMHNLWAPEIHRINDKWYIYYAADDGNTDNHQIYVLENDARTPMEGTFKQKGPIMTNQEWNWGIHASTFVHKGVQYLIWSGWPKRRIMEETQCIYIAKMRPARRHRSTSVSSPALRIIFPSLSTVTTQLKVLVFTKRFLLITRISCLHHAFFPHTGPVLLQ